jgi:hypothetical protein
MGENNFLWILNLVYSSEGEKQIFGNDPPYRLTYSHGIVTGTLDDRITLTEAFQNGCDDDDPMILEINDFKWFFIIKERYDTENAFFVEADDLGETFTLNVGTYGFTDRFSVQMFGVLKYGAIAKSPVLSKRHITYYEDALWMSNINNNSALPSEDNDYTQLTEEGSLIIPEEFEEYPFYILIKGLESTLSDCPNSFIGIEFANENVGEYVQRVKFNDEPMVDFEIEDEDTDGVYQSLFQKIACGTHRVYLGDLTIVEEEGDTSNCILYVIPYDDYDGTYGEADSIYILNTDLDEDGYYEFEEEDGIYIATIVYNDEQLYQDYIFCDCALMTCYDTLLEQIYCNDIDCCSGCDEDVIKAMEFRRSELNKLEAFIDTIGGIISSVKISYTGEVILDSELHTMVEKANRYWSIVEDIISRCGTCSEDAETNGGCTQC